MRLKKKTLRAHSGVVPAEWMQWSLWFLDMQSLTSMEEKAAILFLKEQFTSNQKHLFFILPAVSKPENIIDSRWDWQNGWLQKS